VLAVALLLGWGVMVCTQRQRESYTDPLTGLSVSYPKGWLLKAEEGLAFQALDPGSNGFKTTYQTRSLTISASEPLTSSLAVALSDASLSRAQEGTAFRMLDLGEGEVVHGVPTMEAEYVYVVEGKDLFVQALPSVVRGLDIALTVGDRAFLFSLLAEEDEYNRAIRDFRTIVASATRE